MEMLPERLQKRLHEEGSLDLEKARCDVCMSGKSDQLAGRKELLSRGPHAPT